MPFKKDVSKCAHSAISTDRLFIGRANELLFFRESILKLESPSHNIISIFGQAGVGKTNLIARYIDEAHFGEFKDICLTAIVDDPNIAPASVMEKFAGQLNVRGEFEKALEHYKGALRKLRSERETARDTLIRKTVTEVADSAVKDIPVVGGLLEKGATTAFEYFFNELHSHDLLKDAKRLENPIDDLTRAFVRELNNVKKIHRIILFFDTFEQLAPEIAPWLLDYFLPTDIDPQVVLVVAGRNSIESSLPDTSKLWLRYHDSNDIYSISLEHFTEDETRTYLTGRGITDPARQATIYQLSLGLPFYLGILTSNPKSGIDPAADVVANFLRGIPEREQVKRRLAFDAALLTKPFNQDDLDAFPYLSNDEKPTLYHWLIRLPFVYSSLQDGRHRYHGLAFGFFNRYLFQESRKEYYATRKALADYYEQKLENIQREEGDEVYDSEEWIELVIALIRQLFSLPDEISHIKATGQILTAWYEVGLDEKGQILRVLEDLSRERQDNLTPFNARLTVRNLIAFISYIETDRTNVEKQDTYQFLEASGFLLDKVHENSSFPRGLLAVVYGERGRAYYTLEQYQSALEDFNKVLSLDLELEWGYFIRGYIYMLLADFKNAILDFDHLQELNPEYDSIHAIQGDVYRHMGEYEQALDEFNKNLLSYPEDDQAYFFRGLANASFNKHQPAITDFTRALELKPTLAEAYAERGHSYMALEDYQLALADFTQFIKLTPNRQDILANRGIIYSRIGKHQEALADFDYILEANPAYARVYYERGRTYMVLEDYQLALADFTRAFELDSKLTYALIQRGLVFYLIKEYQKAFMDFDHAVSLDPQYAEAYLHRGETHRIFGHLTEAIADINQAIEIDPEFAWAYARRGTTYRQLGAYEQALSDFNKALAIDPEDDQGYSERGTTYFVLRQHELAIKDFNMALARNAKDIQVLIKRGLSYYTLEQFATAIEDFNSVIAAAPDNADAFTYRGEACRQLGEYERAINDFSQAINVDPECVEAYLFRGTTYLMLNKKKQALVDINYTIELDMTDDLAYAVRGEIYFLLRKYKKAIEDFNRTLELNPQNERVQQLKIIADQQIE